VKIELEAGEEILAEGEVLDLGLGGLPAYLVVTRERLLWAVAKDPGTVMTMRFERISEAASRSGTMKLTECDPEYATMLHDPDNPHGETDAVFGFAETETEKLVGTNDLKDALYRGVVRLSPGWEEWREGAERFHQRQGIPVGTWQDCPMCGAGIAVSLEHVIHCEGCNRFFSDPNWQPVVGEPSKDYRRELVAEEPWKPLLETQLPFVGRTLPWIPPPPWVEDGPIRIPDSSVIEFIEGQL
jgi:hypothetical protein